MDKIKPIKRSPELAPLSREHHDGLLFVWKIRQGLKNETSIEKLRNYTMWFWKQHTKPHFFHEEKILLPYLPADHPMANQMQNEHAQIRELVLSIDVDPDKHCFTRLCDMAERHIRWEERKFMGYLEEKLTKEQLHTIHEDLEKTAITCDDWKDEFWVSK